MPINDNKAIRKSKRHQKKLETGTYGSKQGKQMIQGYDIPNPNYKKDSKVYSEQQERISVGSNYKRDGVKAKRVEGAIPIMSKYGKVKGKLGGAVSRIEEPKRDDTPKPKPPVLIKEKESGFKPSSFSSSGKETIGKSVMGGTKEEIIKKSKEEAKTTGLYNASKSDLDETHRDITEENENAKFVNKQRIDRYNQETADYEKAKEDNKFTFGKGRTSEQKKANKLARRMVGKFEGSRKAYKYRDSK